MNSRYVSGIDEHTAVTRALGLRAHVSMVIYETTTIWASVAGLKVNDCVGAAGVKRSRGTQLAGDVVAVGRSGGRTAPACDCSVVNREVSETVHERLTLCCSV